jgi:glyoxylase-like metal-dependent hydrolase (beta-lactamase superfamily II)
MNPILNAAGLTVFERGWLSSNNVLFDGGDTHEAVLVDTGYCTHAAQTVALIQRSLGGRPLHRIINTHLHSDHCGGNHALQDAFGCSIDVPAGEAEKVDRWDQNRLSYEVTGQQCPRFRRSGLVHGGTTIMCGRHAWQVIASPGHDPESVVLYQPDLELLISADALWENGFGVVFPELEGRDAFDDVRTTLDRLSSLPVRWIIPGHGPAFQDMQGAIVRARRRLDAFVADPVRHARHAAKVLIKFHLLEVQRMPLSELREWIDATAYMRVTHDRHFDSTEFQAWGSELLIELVQSGAIRVESGMVINI